MSRDLAPAFILHPHDAAPSQGQHLRCSLPLPRGQFQPSDRLAVQSSDGVVYPCQTRSMARWPDGSSKWLLVDALVDVTSTGSAPWQLVHHDEPSLAVHPIQITEGVETWVVATGVGEYHLDTKTLRPLMRVINDQGDDCLAAEGSRCLFSIDGTSYGSAVVETIEIEEQGPLVAVITMTGSFDQGPLRYCCRLTFVAGSLRVGIRFTLHNPQNAAHPGGLWDLGDPGSVFFKQLSLVFSPAVYASTSIVCRPEPGLEPLTTSANHLALYQEASGGDHWDNVNHRNHLGQIPMDQRGYVLDINGAQSLSGLRAEPLLWCGGIAVAVPYFWQQCPKQLAVEQGTIQVDLFPARYPDLFEIQGGERSTHEVIVAFGAAPTQTAQSFSAVCAIPTVATVKASAVFADLPGADDLVDQFTSATRMLKKRELIDEYGWRHFGDFYADHEAVDHQGKGPFVSHYNNQYDILAGCYRKALATSDPDWWQLAVDLANHVVDIDIYHTDQDREEYNHGLFWHTDHYAPAGLATHRSYSSEQQGAYALHAGGGGPGAEHCYTSGLKLHYYLTGNPDFRNTVLNLAQWEILALKGPQTLLATLKRSVDQLRAWRWAAGEQQPFPLYPLTRGSGNAVVACLDADELSADSDWLHCAAEIIGNALHPTDDIALRKLENIEIAWSYLVLLQSVAKFLDKKHELGQYDEAFHHARLSLLQYAQWMLEHEYPYLDKPEILEYPNETWAAQELRKSIIFYHAARYTTDADQRRQYHDQAKYFHQIAREQLASFATSSTTRPVALMLQNGWIGSRLTVDEIEPVNCPDSIFNNAWPPTPNLSLKQIGKRLLKETLAAVKQTSLKRELAWLKARLRS